MLLLTYNIAHRVLNGIFRGIVVIHRNINMTNVYANTQLLLIYEHYPDAKPAFGYLSILIKARTITVLYPIFMIALK